jgi:poly-beta-1,6-N-acetyl-D-glucosamine synthase
VSIYTYQLSLYEFILLSILVFTLLIQLFYYLFVYLRVVIYPNKKPKLPYEDLPPVSVVICARNEEANLEKFLPNILEQKYPVFEVVVVDDCSTDDTDMVLKRLASNYSKLRTTVIKPDSKFIHGKKLALTVGIKAARYDWLLLTDADCKPDSENWIANMASNFHLDTQIVLGYGGYIQKPGLLNKLIRFDTFFIAMQYIGFALMGSPYMGVGRNLAYRKDLYVKNKGFASHSHLVSGDDDLFIHQVAKDNLTLVEYSVKSHTRSVASSTFKDWAKQKQRHLTTSPLYRRGTKFMLGLEPFSRLLFWISSIWLLFEQVHLIFVLGLVLFRLVLINIILKLAMNRLKERKILLISLIYDLFSPFFSGTLMLVNSLTQKRSKWN